MKLLNKVLIITVLSLISLYLQAQSTAKSAIQYLSGTDVTHPKTWQFQVSGGRKAGIWSTIQVPSHWEQQGFGTYNYGRDDVTFGKLFKYADEQGFYKTEFAVPDSWKNKEIWIVFEGSMTDTEVKVNGTLAGKVHQVCRKNYQ